MMTAIIDYGMGNLLSVSKAFEFVGGNPKMVSKPSEIKNASAVVLPGVGNFGDGMKNLRQKDMIEPIISAIKSGKPFLGICLGMQLLMEESEEAPGLKGLSIFEGSVLRFKKNGLKIPHMGWNQVKYEKHNSNFDDVPDNSYFYFVHSYYVLPKDSEIIAGTCSYGVDFAASISSENIFATQFHPEKSQEEGLQILRNFVKAVYS